MGLLARLGTHGADGGERSFEDSARGGLDDDAVALGSDCAGESPAVLGVDVERFIGVDLGDRVPLDLDLAHEFTRHDELRRVRRDDRTSDAIAVLERDVVGPKPGREDE